MAKQIKGDNGNNTLTGGAEAEEIYGFGGNDILIGGGGNDILVGGVGNDTLTGGEGKDRFVFDTRGFGTDTVTDFGGGDTIDLSALHIGSFDQLLRYLSESDGSATFSAKFAGAVERFTLSGVSLASLTSGAFVFDVSGTSLLVEGTNLISSPDTLFGALGDDHIFAYAGNDTLDGGDGADVLDGGVGNDLLIGGGGADTFIFSDRGFDSDTVADFQAGDRVDLRALHIGDFAQLQRYLGEANGSAVFRTLWAGGAEQITFQGIARSSLTAADFVFDTSSDPLFLQGSNLISSPDTLFGALGDDQLFALAGDDTIDAGHGSDVLDGGDGDDLLIGGGGKDRFVVSDRAFGTDTIADFTAGDRVDLRALHIGSFDQLQRYLGETNGSAIFSATFGGDLERIVFQDVAKANLDASDFQFDTTGDALVIRGSNLISGPDVLFGARGNDLIYGLAGSDTLDGGDGNDALDGGEGNDLLIGGAGKDRFVISDRGFGSDTIVDFGSGDLIDLRALHIGSFAQLKTYLGETDGSATFSSMFAGATEKITISGVALANLTAKSFVFDDSHAALVVEGTNLISGPDTLFGALGNDLIRGYAGSDTLDGGDGDDLLDGGAGSDILIGGLGADRFAIDTSDAGTPSRDVVRDFSRAQGDRIDLSAIDPSSDFGDQSLRFVKGAFTDVGQVSVAKDGDHWLVSVNLDSNLQTADLQFLVYSAKTLAAADFIL